MHKSEVTSGIVRMQSYCKEEVVSTQAKQDLGKPGLSDAHCTSPNKM